MPPPPSTTAAADAYELRQAIAAGRDAEAARLLRLLAAGGALLPATFAELAAAGLPRSAVALAQLEAGQSDLRETEATDEGGSYLHAAAAAGAGAEVVHALIAAGGCARWGGGEAVGALALPSLFSYCHPAHISHQPAPSTYSTILQAVPSTAGTTTRPPLCTWRRAKITWPPAVPWLRLALMCWHATATVARRGRRRGSAETSRHCSRTQRQPVRSGGPRRRAGCLMPRCGPRRRRAHAGWAACDATPVTDCPVTCWADSV